MKKFLASFLFMFIFIVSCSNSVTNTNDEENTNDSKASDNSVISDNDQTDDNEVTDSKTDGEAAYNDNEEKDELSIPDGDVAEEECSRNDDCPENEFCMKETGSCDTSVMGTCEMRPDDCYLARVISPVCGCDDYTYSTSCWAHAEGVNIKNEEECEGDVMCWNNEACESDEYCEKKIGVCDTSSGVCRTKPDAYDCPPPGTTQPFCGCDLYEYQDICYSASGGIPIKHLGECNGPDDSRFYYAFGANAQSPNGSLRIVMSETDIREYTCSEQHVENMDTEENYITLTINFKNETEHAQLQFSVLMSDVTSDIFPFGMSLGYNESYLNVYDTSENIIAEMQGTVMIYDYSPLFISSQVPTLDVRGLNFRVKD